MTASSRNWMLRVFTSSCGSKTSELTDGLWGNGATGIGGRMKRRAIGALVLLTVGVWLLGARPYARAAETRISIGVTETMETFNPYADSVSLMYSVWCMVLGCLGTYDFAKGHHDGWPVPAEEGVHPRGLTRSDPFARQVQNVAAVAGEAVVDKYTVRITTKG